MFKFLLASIFVVLGAASAQELHDYTINYEIATPEEAEQPLSKTLPVCNNQTMFDQVAEKIYNHQKINPARSIVDERRQALLVKNLGVFNEISVKDFNNENNYLVADALIMTKINMHLKDDDMRLCESDGKTKIYLLIYPEAEASRVQIINFIPPTSKGNDFSILYQEN